MSQASKNRANVALPSSKVTSGVQQLRAATISHLEPRDLTERWMGHSGDPHPPHPALRMLTETQTPGVKKEQGPATETMAVQHPRP